MHVCVCLPTCISGSFPTCLICMPACLTVCLYQYFCFPACVHVCLPTYLYSMPICIGCLSGFMTCLFAYMFGSLPAYMATCMTAYLLASLLSNFTSPYVYKNTFVCLPVVYMKLFALWLPTCLSFSHCLPLPTPSLLSLEGLIDSTGKNW